MPERYDVIVLGIGSMGSAATYYLSTKGYRVLGIDQFRVPHESGSHAGQTRIIRKAYFENPAYVPLLQRAYHNWKELEKEFRQRIYFETGLLYLGSSGNALMNGVRDASGSYGVPLEPWSVNDLLQRFPQFKVPADYEVLFEPEAGFLLPDLSIRLYLEGARQRGAILHTEEPVRSWQQTGDGIRVTTSQGEYQARQLVLTPGAWSGGIIPGLSATIKATQQWLAWTSPRDSMEYDPQHFPCWMIAEESGLGCYYGFPDLSDTFPEGPQGIKLAHHFPAVEVDPDQPPPPTDEKEFAKLENVLSRYFTGKFHPSFTSKTCLYGNSPDEDFIIDFLPGYEKKVVIACGFSGHGFKFASVVGEILADMVAEGQTALPIQFLSASRFTG